MSPACPKPLPHSGVVKERRAALAATDRRQRKLCRLRSGGRCEVVTETARPEASALLVDRCKQKATMNHHLIGGRGARNVGVSILATHRIDVCRFHHDWIHAALLQPTNEDDKHDALTVRFALVRL